MEGKLRFRAVEPEDADLLFAAEKDEHTFENSYNVAPFSREMLRNYALTYDADPFASRQLKLVVELEEIPVGIIDFFEIDQYHSHAMIGVTILPQYRGRGLGTRTIAMASDFACNRLGLNTLAAHIASDNAPSLKAFKKAGFKRAGTLKNWWKKGTRFEDIVIVQKRMI